MAFTYTVPLSVFAPLFSVVDRSLHGDLSERLRAEIDADLGRRLLPPGVGAVTSAAQTGINSTVVGDNIVLFSDDDLQDAIKARGRGLGNNPRAELTAPVKNALSGDRWRYPGGAGNGLLAASVNAVISGSQTLAREYAYKSQQLRQRRGA